MPAMVAWVALRSRSRNDVKHAFEVGKDYYVEDIQRGAGVASDALKAGRIVVLGTGSPGLDYTVVLHVDGANGRVDIFPPRVRELAFLGLVSDGLPSRQRRVRDILVGGSRLRRGAHRSGRRLLRGRCRVAPFGKRWAHSPAPVLATGGGGSDGVQRLGRPGGKPGTARNRRRSDDAATRRRLSTRHGAVPLRLRPLIVPWRANARQGIRATTAPSSTRKFALSLPRGSRGSRHRGIPDSRTAPGRPPRSTPDTARTSLAEVRRASSIRSRDTGTVISLDFQR